MTYRELFEAACALLPAEQAVSVCVETWRHSSGEVLTQWTIWDGERETHYRGDSPAAALGAARAARARGVVRGMPADTDPCTVSA